MQLNVAVKTKSLRHRDTRPCANGGTLQGDQMPYRCPDKRREYSREWVAGRRREFMAGKTCAFCGSTESLELDHVDPTMKVDHRIWSWSKSRREAELAKCRVLCKPCHQGRHRVPLAHGSIEAYKRGCRCDQCCEAGFENDGRRTELIHGTYTAYMHRGCRCDLCKEAKRLASQEKYRRRKARMASTAGAGRNECGEGS